MCNSVISTDDAKYLYADIKGFSLEMPLDRPEYMCMPLDIIPKEFQEADGLKEKVR